MLYFIFITEEDDLLNLLNDMCSNPLLIDERLRDEDFHIFSLVRERARKLGNSPLTPDSALFYLELPHTVLMADAIQPLTIAAKKYLAGQYKDITRQVFAFYLHYLKLKHYNFCLWFFYSIMCYLMNSSSPFSILMCVCVASNV